LRQHKWIELLNNYDMNILYHLGKTNVIVDTLSRKTMESLAVINVEERLLDKNVQRLANIIIWVHISKKKLCFFLFLWSPNLP